MLTRIDALDRNLVRPVLALVAAALLTVGLLAPWWQGSRGYREVTVDLRGMDVCFPRFDSGPDCDHRSWSHLDGEALRETSDELRTASLDLDRWLRAYRAVLGVGAAAVVLLVLSAAIELAGRRVRGAWAPHRLVLIVLGALVLAEGAAVMLTPNGVFELGFGIGLMIIFPATCISFAAGGTLWRAERSTQATPGARALPA